MTIIPAEVDATVGNTTYEMSAYAVDLSTTLADNPAFVTIDIPVDLGIIGTISVTVDRKALTEALEQA